MKKLNLKHNQINIDTHSHSLIVISNHDFFNLQETPKLAIFDLDHTLIWPKAYKSFPINSNDWEYTFSNVK